MKVGLLWSDDNKKPLADIIAAASLRYRQRFGCAPNTCYVHPTQLPDGEYTVNGVAIRSSARVLRSHFWMGIENDQVSSRNDNPA